MSQDYSPSLVTKNLVFCGDAAMKSAAGPATLLYDKVNNNNGTMYNGTCLDLDGSDDYVLVPDGGTYGYSPGNGSWTISMWVNADVFSDNTLLSNTSGSPVTSAFYISTAGKIAFTNYDGAPGWQVHAGDTTLSTGTWYLCTWVNYAGSLSTNATMKMFVNGVADSSEFGSVYTTNGGPVDAIGRITSSYFNGKIADVRFYDVAFSDANVKEIYDDSKVIIPTKNDASGGFVAQTNLKRWWSFAEGAGVLTYDGSGNQADGTMTNMTSADWLTGQTGAPQLVEGYNRKLLFSGDDYVDCGNNSSLNFTTSNFSISCWVYIHDLTDIGYIVRRGGWGSNGWYTYLDSSGKVQIYTNDSAQGDPHTQTVSNSSVITANTWHHVVWVRNGATGVIYVDGTDETASGDSMIDPATSTNTCYIGSATNYISGIVDEVIVYDTVVTSSQAAALHATDANGGPLPPDPMSGASSLPSTSNVVSYWRNEGSGTWTDRGNNSNDGTPAGTPTTLLFKQGINGQKNVNTGRDNQGFPLLHKNVGAIGFNGSSDYIQPSQSLSGPLVSTTGALDFWINFVDSDSNRGLYYLYDAAYADYFILRGGGSGNLTILAESGNSSILSNNTDLSSYMGQWINLVYTQDGTTIRVYVNGVEIDSVASTVWTGHLSATPVCKIGYSVWASNYLNAALASVRVYNRNLTYAEIKQNFNTQANRFQVPRSIVTEGLVLNLDAGNPGSYPGSGTAWYDVSGNGCDFTLDGSGITYSASNGGIFTLADGGASTTSAITANTSCTLVFWMKTTDGQALFWSGPAVDGGYLGAYKSTNKFYNAAALGGASPTFYTNAVQRSNIYDFIRTGEWMMMEFKSVDMSSLTASHFNQYVGYTFGGSSAVGKIMIYNRNLTSAESAQNFRVDRERFGV